MHSYRDVSDDEAAQRAAAFPEIATAFEGLGLVRVGLVSMDSGDPTEAASMYQEPDRSWYIAHAQIPSTVLRTPDADAFVDISPWFGDAPSIRVRSMLADGSIVETLRAQERGPVHVAGLAAFLDEAIGRSQTRGHSPKLGHSIRLLDSRDPAALWAAHREHLAEMTASRDSRPTEHEDIGGYVRLSESSLGHKSEVLTSAGKLTIGLVVGLGLVFLTVIPTLWTVGGTWLTVGILVVVGMAFGALVPRWANTAGRRFVSWFPPPLVEPPGPWMLLRRLAFWSVVVTVPVVVIAAQLALAGIRHLTAMPGESYTGPLPEPTEETAALAERLDRHVHTLAVRIGERHTGRAGALESAAQYVERQLGDTEPHVFMSDGVAVRNLVVEIPGDSRDLVVIGAHYDSAPGTPGADDNATGTAVLIELAKRLRDFRPKQTIRLVAFTNEEPPHFVGDTMGSWVYARKLAADGENVVAMLSLETLGYYDDTPGSQQYPPPFGWLYPDRGDFVAFVGNIESRGLVRKAAGAFREEASLPSEGAAIPGDIEGVGWSDHWSFWQEGWPAIMVTDTAPFRNPHYHEPTDTPETVDTHRLALVVVGLDHVVRRLAGPPPESGRSLWGWLALGLVPLALLWGARAMWNVGKEGLSDFERAVALDMQISVLGPDGAGWVEQVKDGDLGPIAVHVAAMTDADRAVWVQALARSAPIAAMDAWCERAPDDAVAWLFRGAARMAWGLAANDAAARREQLEQAWGDLQLAATLAPDDATPWAWMIPVALMLGRDSADDLFDEAVRRDPHDVAAHAAMLTARGAEFGGGRHAQIVFAREASTAAPEGSALHALVARVYVEHRVFDDEGSDDVAHTEIVRAFEAFSARPGGDTQWMAWNLFAAAFDGLSDVTHARAAFEAIGQRATSVPWTWFERPVEAFEEARERAGVQGP